MAGDFLARMDELIEEHDGGDLVGSVVVDQVYAKYQHERMDLKHPNGGQAKFLSGPLLNDAPKYLQKLAGAVLHGSLTNAMAECMESLSLSVWEKAPRDFWDLRQSGNPRVLKGGAEVYNRPAIVPRLTEQQLREKARLKGMGLGGWSD
ncbi:hypothetical protein SEA_STUFF_19 [Streptomyces phage Stuff]|nr:hypothetical protein SEA_STUFF_19 [Streptomyces phage Stuff]